MTAGLTGAFDVLIACGDPRGAPRRRALRPGPDKPKLIQLSTRSEAEKWHVKAISMLAINTVRVLAIDAGAPLACHLGDVQ